MEPGVKKILMRWKRREVGPEGVVGLDGCITHDKSSLPLRNIIYGKRNIFFIIGNFRLI